MNTNHVEVDHLELVVQFDSGLCFKHSLCLLLLQGQLCVVRIHAFFLFLFLLQEASKSFAPLLLFRCEFHRGCGRRYASSSIWRLLLLDAANHPHLFWWEALNF